MAVGTQQRKAPAMTNSPNVNLDQRLAALSDMSRKDLLACWQSTYGKPPPARLSRSFLEKAIGYELQVQALGGLSTRTRRSLGAALTTKNGPCPRSSLQAGTRLVREWQGRVHEVEVLDDGYLWSGRRHRSLSAIALSITGTKWSGPRFFGLKATS